MAKYKRVRFLKYFNRPRVFVAIEFDTLFLFLGVFIFMMMMLSLTSVVSGFFVFIISMGIAMLVGARYAVYKEKASKGFLKHLLYKYNIYRVDIRKYKKEVERMDIHPDEYYPDANEKHFLE